MAVAADGWIAVVNTAHDIGASSWFYFDTSAPRRVGIRRHARRIKKDPDWISVEAILHKQIVIGRNQEIVTGGDASYAELHMVLQQLLLIGQFNNSESLATINLLDGEDITNTLL